jgi:hypothetical protein
VTISKHEQRNRPQLGVTVKVVPLTLCQTVTPLDLTFACAAQKWQEPPAARGLPAWADSLPGFPTSYGVYLLSCSLRSHPFRFCGKLGGF